MKKPIKKKAKQEPIKIGDRVIVRVDGNSGNGNIGTVCSTNEPHDKGVSKTYGVKLDIGMWEAGRKRYELELVKEEPKPKEVFKVGDVVILKSGYRGRITRIDCLMADVELEYGRGLVRGVSSYDLRKGTANEQKPYKVWVVADVGIRETDAIVGAYTTLLFAEQARDAYIKDTGLTIADYDTIIKEIELDMPYKPAKETNTCAGKVVEIDGKKYELKEL